MKVYITSSDQVFEACRAPYKLCMRYGVIERFSFGKSDEWGLLNVANLHVANEARAAVAEDLARWSAALSPTGVKVNRWMQTRLRIDQLYSALQLAYLEQGTEFHQWCIFLQQFERSDVARVHGVAAVHLLLKPMERLVPKALGRLRLPVSFELVGDRPGWQRRIASGVRNALVEVKNWCRYGALYNQELAKGRKRILFFIGGTSNLFELFERFFHLPIIVEGYYVLVVIYNSRFNEASRYSLAMNAALSAVPWAQTYLEQWQPLGLDMANSMLFDALAEVAPETEKLKEIDTLRYYETWYRALDVAFSSFRPHLALHNNLYDPGRIVSDVARFHKVPSVNVMYSLVPDLPSNYNNIQFDARVHINDWTAALYEQHEAPTRNFVAGYLKLDSLVLPDSFRSSFEETNGFGVGVPTVFFGSTYMYAYDYEKVVFVTWLAEICAEYGWNLLVKKHPSERDHRVAEAVQAVSRRTGWHKGRVFLHEEIRLIDAISVSDVITQQSSGLALEALLLCKPLAYLSLNAEHPEYYKAIDEPFIPLLSTREELADYLLEALSPESNQRLVAQVTSVREKYLYKVDGRASERLLELIESMLKRE